MARNFITALDIGTSTVQTVVAEVKKGEEGLRILGIGIAPSAGVRRGVVVDLEDATAAVRESVDEARKTAGVPIKSAWLGIGGTHVSVASSRGVVAVSRADGEISPEDVRRAVGAAETFIAKNPNRTILHIIPRDFRVDQESGIKDPVGMHGVRLEADTLIIEYSTSLLKNLIKCVEQAGVKVRDYVFSPLAAAEVVLSKRQKELGVMLLDIGGGTASFMVFEEGVPIHAGVIPLGGNHITNDIAVGLRTHVDIAERVKILYGTCGLDGLPKKDMIRLAEFIPGEAGGFSRRELVEIISARLRDIFELLQKELKKIERIQLLPAGVVLVGGSAFFPGLIELAREGVRLPVELGSVKEFGEVDEKVSPSLASALGVLKWGYHESMEPRLGVWQERVGSVSGSSFVKWLKSLLP